jgi:hypothetical protein
MKQFMTSTVEQRKDFTGIFSTHPMEAGWSTEAIFFMTVENIKGKEASLLVKVQISADGIHWMDEGTQFPIITEAGHYFVKVRHYGGWLRLSGEINQSNQFNLTIHLVIKE